MKGGQLRAAIASAHTCLFKLASELRSPKLKPTNMGNQPGKLKLGDVVDAVTKPQPPPNYADFIEHEQNLGRPDTPPPPYPLPPESTNVKDVPDFSAVAVNLTAGLIAKLEGSVPGAAVFTALIGTIKIVKKEIALSKIDDAKQNAMGFLLHLESKYVAMKKK